MSAKQNAPKNEITIITFVSGKGGVGKTMLAVAAAKELSDAQPTLVLDLDFFNRGLSGLLSHGESIAKIERPSFLSAKSRKEDWEIIRASGKLYNVVYPDVSQEEIENLDRLSINQLSEKLLNFIRKAAFAAGCNTVVLDCHGGPDSLSFAACLIAQYSLLISEPDRITMYGTLHFLRKLNSVAGTNQPNIYMVFNKVVEAFSPQFLWKLYNDHLRQFFDNRPLLAAFPLEVYLTKEFEKYPFVTEYYPRSMLAQKMQVLLNDLLSKDRPRALSPAAKSLPTWMQAYLRKSFGRTFYLLTLDFVLPIGFVLLLTVYLLTLIPWNSEKQFYQTLNNLSYNLSDYALPIWLLLAAISLLMAWTKTLDRRITFNAQRRRPLELGMYTLIMILLWFLPILAFRSFLEDLTSSPFDLYNATFLVALGLSILWTWTGQLYQAYRDARYAGNKTNLISRFVAAFILVLIPFAGLSL